MATRRAPGHPGPQAGPAERGRAGRAARRARAEHIAAFAVGPRRTRPGCRRSGTCRTTSTGRAGHGGRDGGRRRAPSGTCTPGTWPGRWARTTGPPARRCVLDGWRAGHAAPAGGRRPAARPAGAATLACAAASAGCRPGHAAPGRTAARTPGPPHTLSWRQATLAPAEPAGTAAVPGGSMGFDVARCGPPTRPWPTGTPTWTGRRAPRCPAGHRRHRRAPTGPGWATRAASSRPATARPRSTAECRQAVADLVGGEPGRGDPRART